MTERQYLVLVADDNGPNRRALEALLTSEGFRVVIAEDGRQAIDLAMKELPDVALLDLRMPVLDGVETLAQLKQLAPDLPVILLTSYGDLQTAAEAMTLGAHDFLLRPAPNAKLVHAVRRALERAQLTQEVQELRAQLETGIALTQLLGSSPPMQAVVKHIQQVAPTNFSVVIEGKTGTGKELVARAIHEHSARRDRRFVAIDCGAIPDTLLESELFGYEKGAFSGADRRKDGLLTVADRGTLFLDEVSNLPLVTQAKLLRVIQQREVQALGSTRAVPVDVRILTSTNEPLQQRVATGSFRQDLFYRLTEFVITLPPLCERGDDILLLARRFQEEASLDLKRPSRGLTPDAAAALRAHSWPGNVRELRNVIRQAVLQSTDPVLTGDHLRTLLASGPRHEPAASPEAADVAPGGEAPGTIAPASLRGVAEQAAAEAEKDAIRAALLRTAGNKSRAARLLRTDFKTLHLKMKRYGLDAGSD